ncbi:MAG: CoA transferase [Pseudomonadota bacterium]
MANLPTAENIEAVSQHALRQIWSLSGLPEDAIHNARLDITEPTLPSSFHVAAMATSTISAAALAAAELWRLRTGQTQTVKVSSRHAEAEFLSVERIRINKGPPRDIWGPIAGLYQCGDGRWVRIHANFPHHEAGALAVLKCEPTKDAVAQTLRKWTAPDFEDACGETGLPIFMMRSPQEWSQHPQGAALASLPLFDMEKIGEAPVEPLPADGDQPLSGIKVLDLTRVIAGPVGGRTLAAHGAHVTRIAAERLHRDSLALEADAGRGKQSELIDLATADGRKELAERVPGIDVFSQGYRPGAIDAKGFTPERLAELRPGIVCVSVSAWGHEGPWAGRRGFDSLVQTATGINVEEAEAAGVEGPKPLPCQALDYASGHLLALGAMAGLYKRATEGGSWKVRVALARTRQWLGSLGRIDNGFGPTTPSNEELPDLMTEIESGYGQLYAVKYPAQLSSTPAQTQLAPVPYPYP